MKSSDNGGSDSILHFARTRNSKQLALVLAEPGIEINAVEDGSGSNALHLMFSDVCLNPKCQTEALICAQLLVKAGIAINLQNRAQEVPLFLALKNDWNASVLLLAKHGADLTVRIDKKTILATYLANKMPDVLCALLDEDASTDGASDDIICVDFRNVLQYPSEFYDKFPGAGATSNSKFQCDETAFLQSISASAKNTKVFQHPVLLLFLALKYRKLQPNILFSLLWHAMIITLYSCYVYFVYVDICPYDVYKDSKLDTCKPPPEELTTPFPDDEPVDGDKVCTIPLGLKVVSGFLTAFWVGMLATELQIWWNKSRRSYFTKETIPWFVFYVLMPITLWPSIGTPEAIDTWRYPVAAGAIFLIWALCVDQFGKIKRLSVIFEMFTKVALKILMLALFFLPLFIGFTMGFFVMDAESIQTPYSLVTIIGMMVGDTPYGDLFDECRDSSVIYEIISYFLYLMFILLMTVVFINFLLALTINDIKELWDECEKSQTKNQIQLMYIFDRLKMARLKVFTETHARERGLEYPLNIKNPPSYVDNDVIQKLRHLAVKRACRHLPIGSPRMVDLSSTPGLPRKLQMDQNGEATLNRIHNLNRDEARIIHDALQILAQKLNTSTT